MSAAALNLVGAALRYALEQSTVPCWVETAGKTRFVNRALAALVGAHDAAEIVGAPTADLLGRTPGAVDVQPETLLAGLAPAAEEAELKFRGKRISVEITRTVITFDGELMVLCVLRDVSPQRDLQAALREAEERLRQLLDSNLIGIIEIDGERILSANDYFLKMVGRSREQLEGGDLQWREMTPPECAADDEEFVAHILRSGDCVPVEKEFVRADGTRVPVLLRCAKVAQAADWRALCFVIDLTDRKKVEEFTAERLRFESVGMLAAGIAHSFNNLLTTVVGNAGLLLEQKMIAESPRHRDLVNEIIATGEQAAALASQLLAYSGQGRFVVSSANLRELIGNQLDRTRALQPPNLRLTSEIADDVLRVVGDPRQLTFLVEALIANAFEAVAGVPNGEVFVGASIENVSPGVLSTRSGTPLPGGDYCLLRVRDNGPGMSTTTLARCFEPFFSTRFQGRGLGLAAVDGIVKASRGAVRVITAPGKGCEFQVFLPSSTEAASGGGMER
jgi:PAS domain S-box-containing protein